MDPMPEVPTLLYIGRRDRVIEGAIRLIDCVPSLLHNMCNKLVHRPDTPSLFALISMLVDRVSPCGPPP
jgi:hypothetical protein